MPYYDHDEEHQHKDTPQEALIVALGKCQMEDPFAEVLIIWNTKSGKSGSSDSGLTISESGFLCDLFKGWLINSALKGPGDGEQNSTDTTG